MEASAHLVGRQVGDFRLLDEIGEGGMGTAYRAEQLTLRREAVVKVISVSVVSEAAKARFLREARLASHLDHPYAAHVYAFGAEPDGLLWIAMELVRGIPLDRLIADQGAMPLERFVPFFERLCEVVHSAHEQGIIHRDIKPANVMVVRRAGRLLPKLLDFGVARGTGEIADVVSSEVTDSPLEGTRSITLRGAQVGSPEYMAPEQWMDATKATARTDLYALAITAYEVLTTKRPFTGPTVKAVARAHARNDVPRMGPGFPPALDQIFARALAKRAEQRFDNVLELAAAIREVARGSGTQVFDLEQVVRDTFVQHGPQPLAEAMLELVAARAPATAWEAGWRVVNVLVRTLGVVALAARARLGERVLASELAARVVALIERGLDTEEWIAFVAALVEPFAQQPQAHPVPELVGLLWTGGQLQRPFDELLARRRAADVIDAEQMSLFVVELGAVLRACAFLTDYRWVVARNGGERWMGPRRHPRDPTALPAEVASDTVWLVDRDGAPIIELSPLVQIAPPAPGVDDEAFLIDGPAKRGVRVVAWPREFERFDEQLWQFVDRQLAPLRDRVAAAEREDTAPYRGLASFGPGDATMFFGREREVEAVVNRLRVQPLIAAVGPSGVGKSSFVHAGVLPALPQTWQLLSLRPGPLPLAAVESSLEAAGIAARGLADRLCTEPAALGVLLADAAHRQATRVVIVIDQLEEMFTQCRDTAMRDHFARALSAIKSDSPVHVILTLRDDFLVRAAELPGLGPRLQAGLELVTLPDPTALRRILVEPLRHVGYKFEVPTLPDEMVASVREHPGALALLSFAAAKLWELRDRGFRHIPKRAYEAIGGVAGALARHAEETLSALPESDHALVRELFRHLVTSEGTRAMLHRVEAIQLLGKGPSAERVIETLVKHRLIVGYEGDARTDRIEVIHEALLTAWPRLVAWQREDAEGARLRDQLRSAARQWGERGRPKGLLWRGEALVELKLWRSRHGGALTDLERDFSAASIADDARAKRLRRLALAAVMVGLIVGLVVLQRANKVAERNANESRRNALAMLVEQGRAFLVANHPQESMVYLSEAYSRGAEDPNLPFLLGAAGRAVGGERLLLRGHAGVVKWGVFTRDGLRIASAGVDGTVRVWSARTGALERTMFEGDAQYLRMRLTSRDEIFTVRGRETPSVWDPATGKRRFALATSTGAFGLPTADGDTIVTFEPDKLRTWSGRDGSPIREIPLAIAMPAEAQVDGDRYLVHLADGVAVGHASLATPPIALPISNRSRAFLGGGGKVLVSIDAPSRDLKVWNVDRGGEPIVLTGHTGDAFFAEVSHDGTRIASSSFDRTVKLWDARTGRLLTSLEGHDGYVGDIAWSADDRLLATGSVDHTARLWDVATGSLRAVFYGHADVVNRVAFDARGQRVVTASADGTVRVFEARPTAYREIDLHHEAALSVRFSKDSRRLVAVGHDGTAWVYDVAAREIIASFDRHTAPPPSDRITTSNLRVCGDLDATGEILVTPAGADAYVTRLADRDHPTVLRHAAAVTCARFASNGRVVTSTADGRLYVWNADARLGIQRAVHSARIGDIEVEPGAATVATTSSDGTAKLVDLATGSVLRTITVDHTSGDSVSLSRDTTRIALAGDDATVRIVDAATGTLHLASHSASDVTAVEYSGDDRRIAVATVQGIVEILDSADGRLLARFGDTSHGWVTSVALSPDGAWVAAGDDRGFVQLWALAVETRPAAVIASEVACHVPLQLVGTRLISHANAPCTTK